MAKSWDAKDPDETLDYEIDWSARMVEGDAIALSEWEIDDTNLLQPVGKPPELDEASHTTKIWLTGGEIGATYEVLNRVTTDQGRVMDQTVKIKIKEK